MIFTELSIGAVVALICGLDRTAAFQIMISRPIVAAPLVAWLLGDISAGLEIGLMVELLWLARLPVGAAIPPDDTQVSIAGTVLAVSLGRALGQSGLEYQLLCLLIAIPLGKFGQFFDRYARQYNGSKVALSDVYLEAGNFRGMEQLHRLGICCFSLAALGTYLVIICGGLLIIPILAPLLIPSIGETAQWLRLDLPLVGIAVLLGTANVSRSLTLFGASFGMAFLLMWLV
ncbi:PTS sugar transporter subunit IIC [Geopsychrobacter electrodiphilus]|uniref:PTS sugar transporter subunit IIC n=1 Tax=Geopsychrobacter electrodiphilus TaxID=225196 RepID=UPI00037D247E|nr:PTS sugar transporter subunit IIC [Geopsychrobacter electrodiphilus]